MLKINSENEMLAIEISVFSDVFNLLLLKNGKLQALNHLRQWPPIKLELLQAIWESKTESNTLSTINAFSWTI